MMREKLIELIGQSSMWDLKSQPLLIEQIADHLLANGVIVPPCKVGDTLWLPISDRVIAYEVSKIKYDGDLLKIVTHNKLSGMQRTIWSCDVGATTFLTREEAERALRKEDEGK
jgi:hypothetical protein